MKTLRSTFALIAGLVALATPAPASTQTTAFVGAQVWDGTGAATAPLTLVVEDGRLIGVSLDPAPSGVRVVDLEGQYVIPGLIDVHAHVSGRWAPDASGDEARIRGDLRLFSTYGVTTVNSLGDGSVALSVAGDRAPDAVHARLLAAGVVVADATPEAARSTALENVRGGADWLKLRVDDNLGTATKMPWDAVQAVIDVGAEAGVPVATHLFYLDDAKRLLNMGTGLIAHSIRDQPVDDAVIAAIQDAGVCYVPTLTREVSTFVYASRPGFFDDPFFTEYASASEIDRLSRPESMESFRTSPAAAGYRVALRQALENVKTLSEAGVPIAFGTDAGPAGRFPGYFQHMELALMVGAGLTPEEALTSATRTAADCLGLADRGTLEPGKWADFVVTDQDPLRDITHTKTLRQVYVGGRPVR